MTLRPAPVDSGIVFRRMDLEHAPDLKPIRIWSPIRG
jgi:hypothetical protein